jgi:hypothetical protein
MTSILDLPHPLVMLRFSITNVGAGATPVDGVPTGAQSSGATGYPVPSGYKFVPVYLHTVYNAARSAGTSTVKITDNGTELVGGPEALIDSTNTLTDDGSVNGDPASVPAGHTIGCSATGSGTFAPTTADADVVALGYYKPA